jgi:hypothetical protein
MAITSHIKITSVSLLEFICTTSMNLCNTWKSPYNKLCQNNYLLLEEKCTTEFDIESKKVSLTRGKTSLHTFRQMGLAHGNTQPMFHLTITVCYFLRWLKACVGRSGWWGKLIPYTSRQEVKIHRCQINNDPIYIYIYKKYSEWRKLDIPVRHHFVHPQHHMHYVIVRG